MQRSGAVGAPETGEAPLWRRWLRPGAKLWSTAARTRSAPDSLMHQALATTTHLAAANTTLTPAWQPWAGQLAAAMAAVGQPLDLATPTPVPLVASPRRRAVPAPAVPGQASLKATPVGAWPPDTSIYERDACSSPLTAE